MKPFFLLAALAAPLCAQPPVAPPPIQRLAIADAIDNAASVRVADMPLIFTGQIGAPDASADASAQASRALDALQTLLAANGSGPARIVRLNACVATDSAVPAVEAVVAERFAGMPVAFTLVRTPLSLPDAAVVFDAVAASARATNAVVVRPTHAILPAGGKIFVSGQAEKGTDLASSSRLTMEKLFRAVAHLGLTKADVVQVKAFIRPFADHAAASREIAASFDGKPAPPIVLLEWQSDLFTEIELVLSAKSLPPPAGDSISHSFLPWLTRSPRYCHVTHIAAGTPLIFIGGIAGIDSTEPRAQMKTIFERLGSVLFEAGSSYRQLAKATYYLADPRAQALLGDIRGVYFDPSRPPAASAIRVPTLGHAGRAAMVDMIAVPAGK